MQYGFDPIWGHWDFYNYEYTLYKQTDIELIILNQFMITSETRRLYVRAYNGKCLLSEEGKLFIEKLLNEGVIEFEMEMLDAGDEYEE